jgi:hypothetical protein
MAIFRPEEIISVRRSNGVANRIDPTEKQFHDWYRFVLSFPPHLVREYIEKFGLSSDQTLLDPFCGTGTTLVVAKARGIPCIGVEANPMAAFASKVKVSWDVSPDGLEEHAKVIADQAKKNIANGDRDKLKSLPLERMHILIKDSISPLPLHKSLILLDTINQLHDTRFHNHELLAFAKSTVLSASNLHFGPEVGVRREKRVDAPVVEAWLSEISSMTQDLCFTDDTEPIAKVHLADSRQLSNLLTPISIDAVFTSPPYPNEKDYTRTTRLESVLLGFIHSKEELRRLKKGLLCSNSRTVFKGDDDDKWISQFEVIQEIARAIERRRIELNKTSGFERQYSRVTKLYFGGMARHLSDLRPLLKRGAQLGYVVGDQASYLQVMIKTGEILAEIAQSLGYEVERIDLFRTRFASATKQQIREEVVVLRWPGDLPPINRE